MLFTYLNVNGCGKWVIKPCPEITDNMASYEKWLIIVFLWGGGVQKKNVTRQILEGSVFQLMLRRWGNIFFHFAKKLKPNVILLYAIFHIYLVWHI